MTVSDVNPGELVEVRVTLFLILIHVNRKNIDKTNKQANEEIKNVLLDFF